MIEFSCDYCSRMKGPQEAWILGIAAETVGYTAVRRQATILFDWNRESAVLPLAVHFCSPECKDKHMAQLFDSKAPAEDEVILERVSPQKSSKEVIQKDGGLLESIKNAGTGRDVGSDLPVRAGPAGC